MSPLEAFVYMMGKELQEVGGRPVVRTTVDFAPEDTDLYVESILGFTEPGWLWGGGIKLQYETVSLTSSPHFTGVTTWRSVTIPRGSYVVSSVRDLRPAAYELFWPISPAAVDFYE